MPLFAAQFYLASWSLIGAVLFSGFVIFAFRTGVVYTSRREDGLLMEKNPLSGYLASLSLLLAIVGFLVLGNYLSLVQWGFILNFGILFTQNLLQFLILFSFDMLVIDGFVLGRWQPDLLHIPDATGWTFMQEHMLKSLPVGLIFGLILLLLSSGMLLCVRS